MLITSHNTSIRAEQPQLNVAVFGEGRATAQSPVTALNAPSNRELADRRRQRESEAATTAAAAEAAANPSERLVFGRLLPPPHEPRLLRPATAPAAGPSAATAMGVDETSAAAPGPSRLSGRQRAEMQIFFRQVSSQSTSLCQAFGNHAGVCVEVPRHAAGSTTMFDATLNRRGWQHTCSACSCAAWFEMQCADCAA